MRNNVKMSQLALLLLILLPGGKYISLPVILATQVGRDSWIVVALLLLFDLVALSMLLWGIRHNVNKYNFVQILDSSIGVVGRIVVLVIMLCWLSLRMITLATSMYNVFYVAFGIKANWLGYVLPLIAVMLFLISRGFMCIARLNQILSPLIFIAVLSIIVYPLLTVDKSNLLPILSGGADSVLGSLLGNNFWFADYFFLYFVLGDIKITKGSSAFVLFCFGVGALLCVAMNGVFIALYGALAPYTDLAMSKVSQYSLVLSSSGRLDWLSLSVWTLSVFIKLSVLAYSIYVSIVYLFGICSTKLHPVPASIIALLMFVPLLLPASQLLEGVLSVLTLPLLAVQYLLPLLMPWFVHIANKRKQQPQLLGSMEVQL